MFFPSEAVFLSGTSGVDRVTVREDYYMARVAKVVLALAGLLMAGGAFLSWGW